MGRIRREGAGDTRAVYSTESGRIDEPAATRPSPGSADGIVRVSRTKAGRKGKTVTLVTGLPPAFHASSVKGIVFFVVMF